MNVLLFVDKNVCAPPLGILNVFLKFQVVDSTTQEFVSTSKILYSIYVLNPVISNLLQLRFKYVTFMVLHIKYLSLIVYN